MKYYIAEDKKLYQFNPETRVARLRSTIGKQVIETSEFENLKKIEIKKQEFSRLMNLFFNNLKHEWEFEGVRYKKLPNFESNEHFTCTNYEFAKLPRHKDHYGYSLFLVYHWGRVYYFTWSYNGYPQGQLIDIKTDKVVRWAKPKHCAPILNIETNKIV